MPGMHRLLQLYAARLPWPARAVVGLVAVGVGAFLLTRPLDSLTALALCLAAAFLVVGVTDLAREDRDTGDTVSGAAWTLLAIVVVAAPGHVIGALPAVAGIALLVAGALDVAKGRRGATLDARVATSLLGLAQVVLGILALAWGDLTLVVLAALFGIVLVVSGSSLAGAALLHRDRPRVAEERRPGKARRLVKVLSSVVALVLGLVLLAVSGALRNAAPTVDAFYSAPGDVPDEPGRLLRAESFSRQVPAGAHGWRILYTTTDALGEPTLASGIVVVPGGRGPAPRPVIAWAHGTTGYARRCAPSLLDEPFTAGAFPDVLGEVLSHRWAVVATDYAGLGTAGHQPYLIGAGEARSVLDSVRAARQLAAADLSDETVVWGHSQGGGAALWTSQEQPAYAPDVPLLGTVAMAPAADPLSLARTIGSVTGGSVLGSFVASAYADTYPDVRLGDFVRPAAVAFVRRLASRCLAEPGVLASGLTALSLRDQPILSTDPGRGALGRRLRANISRDPGPGPLLVAQGLSDGLVVPAGTQRYVERLRRDGHEVEYRTYPGLGHMALVQAGSALLPDLLAWTRARFADRAATAAGR